MAAIAAVHAEAPSWNATDWHEIVGLTTCWLQCGRRPSSPSTVPSPLGWRKGPQAGLTALDELATEPLLATYSYLASARANFLHRLDRKDESRAAYEEALLLSENAVERTFLTDRLSEIEGSR